jgi:hypothetical protein
LFGLTGAAVATSASLIIWNTAMAVFLWRRLQLLPGVLAMLRSRLAKERTPARREVALPSPRQLISRLLSARM